MDEPPLVGADGTIYVANRGEEFVALDGKTGGKKWGFKVDGQIERSPLVATDGTARVWPEMGSDGTLFVACEKT